MLKNQRANFSFMSKTHMRALYLLIRGTEYPQQTACPYWISVKNKW